MTDKNGQDYVEERLIDAETSLEEAIRACEDPKLTGELLGEYRDIVLTLKRLRDGRTP